MSKIKIATDSTADIPKSFCEELNISVLPLTILAGEKEYRDGVEPRPNSIRSSMRPRRCRCLLRWLRYCIQSCLKKHGRKATRI